jgi:FAD/FMN-containing dehydrogenase
LEAEIVTADGRVRVVNEAREPDLFWALKGGGGGTFGVVTRLTLATHELPETFGGFSLDVAASSDAAYHRLLARFVDVYATRLFNPHWGETVVARPDNRLEIRMVFQGLPKEGPTAAWQPLLDFIAANGADYPGYLLNVGASPARFWWDAGFRRRYARQAVVFDSQPGASPDDFWWSSNTDEAGAFWYAYTSVWLPQSLLKPENRARFVDAWFAASRHWGAIVAFNKGLAGAPADAIEAARNTATNPDVVDAFAWAITGAYGPPAYLGLPLPDLKTAAAQRARVDEAMKALRAVAPDTGTYLNECDYFQPDWQRAFWGPNYPRLLAIKRRYDPEGIFTVHHGVGSEA